MPLGLGVTSSTPPSQKTPVIARVKYITVVCPKVIIMPASRCVVQFCSNRANREAGVSIHLCPMNKSQRNVWVNFVKTHRANFNPVGRFVICSDHFNDDCFERTHFGLESGSLRRLKPGSVPTMWKKKTVPSPISQRNRRRVSAKNGASHDMYSSSPVTRQDNFTLLAIFVELVVSSIRARSWSRSIQGRLTLTCSSLMAQNLEGTVGKNAPILATYGVSQHTVYHAIIGVEHFPGELKRLDRAGRKIAVLNAAVEVRIYHHCQFTTSNFCSFGCRQEVNSEIEERIKWHEKHYSLVLHMLINFIANNFKIFEHFTS